MKSPAEIRVLIVEDDEAVRKMVVNLFKTFGFGVDEAADGQTGYQKFATEKCDVVLTDVRMPNVNGIELLKKIRAKNPVNPCVLMISGHADYALDALYDMGANGFLAKPFGAASVRDAIQRAVLRLEDQWGHPRTGGVNVRVGKHFDSMKAMLASGEVSFGNGGFFVQQSNPVADPEAGVAFSFVFKQEDAIDRIEGQGTVRWVRNIERPGARRGLGIEIKYLADNCRDRVCEWLRQQKFTAYIPKD